MYFVPYGISYWIDAGRTDAYRNYLEEAEIWEREMLANEPETLSKESKVLYPKEMGETNVFQDSTTQSKFKGYTKPNKPTLNTLGFHETDSLVLQVVSGVGPVIAGRIIKYRDNLGGFFSPSQMLEVYGVEESLAEKIYQTFPFEPVPLKKLKLNSVSLKELAAHPYVKYGEAKVILAYREQHGALQGVEDLLKIKIFNEEWLARLQPYLEL
ncbi:ComEA family DNA-binding protein [Pleomorphovibrio marinus]|uniref:ComEA family DNA-binding protein n=1 Tax=Pleomorphovibrio marinus TaxID=2164132 RepID=UPI0018E50674|nr:helix-hairpin-helix domain-containing protein [Pleomorphovibrio marinus]